MKAFIIICFFVIILILLKFHFNIEKFIPSNSFEVLDIEPEKTIVFPQVNLKEINNNYGDIKIIDVIPNQNTDIEINNMKKIVENFIKENYPEIVLNFIIEYKKSNILLVKTNAEDKISTSFSEEILYSFYLNIFVGKNPELWNLEIIFLDNVFKPLIFKKESFVKKIYKANEDIDKLFRIKNSLGLLSYLTSQAEMDFVDYNGKSVNEWLNIKDKI